MIKPNLAIEIKRLIALRMISKGLTSKQIGNILNVSRQTIAAWKAHKTMGTYKNVSAKIKY